MNDLSADLFGNCPGHGGQQIHLASSIDLDGFRRAARHLIARCTPPEQVTWVTASSAKPQALTLEPAPAVTVGADFMSLCKTVILHSDHARFGLLYRLLWRMAREPSLQHDPLDADMLKAEHLANAVGRDMHKMKVFVRFRTVADEAFKTLPTGGPLHVAWFEPEHHIVEAIAPFFARRFTQMRWAILTPERCMAWNGAVVCFSPGVQKSDAPPAHAGEALWLTCYQNTFNRARLKLKMVQKETPRHYWHNLPEAQFISDLSANQRQMQMIGQASNMPQRPVPALKPQHGAQQALYI